MDFIIDVLLDAILDTAQLIPFLFLTYVAMEAIEHSSSARLEKAVASAGSWGPIAGALVGAVPQCGFSAMASTLFAGGVITIGTLFSVFLSTSDELVPVFLAHQEAPSRLFAVLGLKVLIGLISGLLLDVVLRVLGRAGELHPHIEELCERAHCRCYELDQLEHEHEHEHEHTHEHGHSHSHDHGNSSNFLVHILRAALSHTVQVIIFIFVISLVLGFIIEGVGQDALSTLFSNHPVSAVFLAALVGLIPNCGASVAIAELFLSGTFATGALLAGLLANAGVGLLVLYRTNTSTRQNITITVLVYAFAVLWGLLASGLGIMI